MRAYTTGSRCWISLVAGTQTSGIAAPGGFQSKLVESSNALSLYRCDDGLTGRMYFMFGIPALILGTLIFFFAGSIVKLGYRNPES